MKKALAFTIVFFAPLLAFADSTSSIQLPSDFTPNMLGVANATMTNFSPLTLTIIGLLLGLTAIGILIEILLNRGK